MLNARATILEAIQKAATQAAEKQVEVKVEFHEVGFMGDRVDATVTATPTKKKE
jgi:hypothetical protein